MYYINYTLFTFSYKNSGREYLLLLVLLFVYGIIILFALLNIINIPQSGSKKKHNRTMKDIIGKDPALTTYDDIENRSRNEKMQLFIAASTQKLTELNGEI